MCHYTQLPVPDSSIIHVQPGDSKTDELPGVVVGDVLPVARNSSSNSRLGLLLLGPSLPVMFKTDPLSGNAGNDTIFFCRHVCGELWNFLSALPELHAVNVNYMHALSLEDVHFDHLTMKNQQVVIMNSK